MTSRPEITFGTRIRKSPFFDSTIKWGCNGFTVYNKMYMPTFYKSFVDDYWSLVNNVTLWDVAGERQVEITGKNAEKFIEYITPRDISKCKIGQCMYVLLTEKNGGIVNDPVLLKLGNNHYWLSIADSDVLLWCKGIASSNNFNVNINEPDVSPLSLQGPKALQTMEKIVGPWAREMKFFYFKETEIESIPVVVARSGWSGEVGFEIFLRDGSLGNKLWEIIMKAGEEFNIAPAAPSQINRIESGMLSYGSDMTLEENPYDINLDKFVNLDKQSNCLSREALSIIYQQGSKKELVGIEIEDEPYTDFVADHLMLRLNNELVGKITSSVYSPRLKKNIGLALINRRKKRVIDGYSVSVNGSSSKVKICNLPFLRNK
jgi:aminomethyltransferase